MKKRKIIIELARRLFKRRREDALQVYLKRFETIDALIADDRIAIDIVKCYVVLDTSVHALYMYDDAKYDAFFDTLRAYINYHRGCLHIETPLKPEDRIDFGVALKLYQVFDFDTGEFYNPPHVNSNFIVVGYHQDGKLDYKALEEKPNSTEPKQPET